MGALSLPAAGGSVYVDANVLVYTVEAVPPYAPLLDPFWAAVAAGRLRAVGSELLAVEVLTKPRKVGDPALYDAYDAALASSDLHLLPITLPVLKRAAELRAAHNMKTPDAIHAATALVYDCGMFRTNDNGFRRVPGLRVQVLSEALAIP